MGFFFDEDIDGKGKEKWIKVFGDIEVIVECVFVFGKFGFGGGMLIYFGNVKFFVVG